MKLTKSDLEKMIDLDNRNKLSDQTEFLSHLESKIVYKNLFKDLLLNDKEIDCVVSFFCSRGKLNESNFFNRILDLVLGLTFFAPELHDRLKKEKSSQYFDKNSSYYHFCIGYNRLFTIFNYLKDCLNLTKDETIVDFGSGYGRVGQFVGYFYPENTFLGFEIYEPLVDLAIKLKKDFHFKNVSYQKQDLLSINFKIPKASYYFFYDPFSNQEGDLFYKKLEEHFKNINEIVYLIVCSGWNNKTMISIEQFTWLECIHSFEEYEDDCPIRIYCNKKRP